MPTLGEYLTRTKLLLNQTNPTNTLYPEPTLITYVNEARRQVASEGQCVRALLPPNRMLAGITVTAGASGYAANPSVIIGAPDLPTIRPPITALAQGSIDANGVVVSAQILLSGYGYFSPPAVAFTSSALGNSASGSAIMTSVCGTSAGVEVYSFAQFSALLRATNPGADSILNVIGVSVIWGTARYTPMKVSFTRYQSQYRVFSGGFQNRPAVITQHAQGVNGTIYMFPVPDQPYPMEWDVTALPAPLLQDSDIDLIPYPWTEPVPYFAAYLALFGVQRFDDADKMMKGYDHFMKRSRSVSEPGGAINQYGRG